MSKLLVGILATLTAFNCYAAPSVKTFIPDKAKPYFEIIDTEATRLLPGFYSNAYFGSLIEHESCISLAHKGCWDPKSQLSTKRELGIGLAQLTKTYRVDGSIRFDALSDLRRVHMSELKELSWSNIRYSPNLQIRGLILMTKDNYQILNKVSDRFQRLAMTDAAYNGGIGGVTKERRACGLSATCNPSVWFGNVERVCLKSRKPLYSGRSACDINRHHVSDVLITRLPKYRPYFT